jgi:hypothetical protein
MPGEIQPHDLVVSSEVRKLIIPEAAVATPAMHKHESGFIVVAGHMVPDRDAIGRVRSAGEAIERRLAAAAGEHHCNYTNEIGDRGQEIGVRVKNPIYPRLLSLLRGPGFRF